MMRSSRGTDALIALEDDCPDVLFETVPGTQTLIWPQLRMYLARAVSEVELSAGFVPAAAPSPARLASQIVRAYLPDRNSAHAIRDTREWLFAVAGETATDGTRPRNLLIDDFAHVVSDSAVIVQDRPLTGRRPRSVAREVETYSFAPSLTRVTVAARRARLSPADGARATAVIREIVRRYPFDVDAVRLARIEKSVLYQLSRVPHLNAQFARILDRVQPRTCVLEDASYGNRATLIEMMKDRGILVIEPQHGWIGPAHGAYNFGRAGSTEAFRRTLPDVLLTFGEFWSTAIRYPAAVVAVGKPHLEAMAADAPPLAARRSDLLVVSSVSDPEGMAAFTREIREASPPDWRVLFRPHPSERAEFDRLYPGLVDGSGIVLDDRADLYETLTSVRGVVGVSSTVLFEAAAFGVHVFVKESPFGELYVGDVFGERISTAEGISRMITRLLDPGTPRASVGLDQLWRPHAVANFRALADGWRGRGRPDVADSTA